MCILLFTDDAVLIVDSEECLQKMVNEMQVVCGRRELMVNVNEGKIIKVHKSGGHGTWNVQLNEEKMEELNSFWYM